MRRTRRQWLVEAGASAASLLTLHAAGRKDFWENTDAASWSKEQKQGLLGQSPWAQQGLARIEAQKDRNPNMGYGKRGRLGDALPQTKAGVVPGRDGSVPIGSEIPPPPNSHPGDPVEFPVLARWENATPVKLAGGPPLPPVEGEFYVIRLIGLPLMPPPKLKKGEAPYNPNEGLLYALKRGSRLERKNKPSIGCEHLVTGSGDATNHVLLFFPRKLDPIAIEDKLVTLECWFAPFHLSVKFALKDMLYRGQLAL